MRRAWPGVPVWGAERNAQALGVWRVHGLLCMRHGVVFSFEARPAHETPKIKLRGVGELMLGLELLQLLSNQPPSHGRLTEHL